MGRVASKLARLWNSSRSSRTAAAGGRRSQPQFEGLEDRLLMYSTPIPDGISFSNGTVRVIGSDQNDTAAVVMESGMVKVSLARTYFIELDINTTVAQTMHDPDKFYDPAIVTRVYFSGRGGNDSFRNDTGATTDALGGDGSDLLVGGSGDDDLLGGEGGDTLEGRGGNDELEGGAGSDSYTFAGRSLGSDTVIEAAGLDADELDLADFGKLPVRYGALPLTTGATINLATTAAQTVNAGHLTLAFSDAAGIEDVRGTARADAISGNTRNNRIYGYGGDDNLDGLGANDSLYGGDGNDDLNGGSGNDAAYGEDGDDLVQGSSGNDTVSGGVGNDSVNGNSGDDWVYGGSGNDVLRGDAGSDHLNGDSGNDTLYGSVDLRSWLSGGDGNDTLVSVGNATNDALTGGAGFDSFWCDSQATETTDADSAEINAEHLHRIGNYYACSIDDGETVQNLGAPGLARNGMSLADPVMEEGDSGTLTSFEGNPLFSNAGPSRDDIDQGSVGDCYFVAALSAIAGTNPDVIRQAVADLGDGTYAVNFHGVFGMDVYVRVDADLWASGGGTPIYANLGAGGSLWAPIIEKAYAFYKNAKGNYGSINGGNGAGWTTSQALGVAKSSFDTGLFVNATSFVSAMRSQWLAGKAITVGGPAPFHSNTEMDNWDNPATDADENTYRRGAHVYTLVSVASDLSSVTLRNPWSDDGNGSTDADPNDGYVTISADLLFYCSGGFSAYTV